MSVHGLLSAAAQARPDAVLVVDGAARRIPKYAAT